MLLWMRHASYLVLTVTRITCRPFPLLENISLQSRLTMRITNHTSISIFETNFQHCPRVVRRVSWCFISRKWWHKFNYDCVTPLRPPYLYSHRFSGPPPRKSLGNRIIRMAGVLCGNVRFSTAARWSRWKYHFLLPITGVILIDNTLTNTFLAMVWKQTNNSNNKKNSSYTLKYNLQVNRDTSSARDLVSSGENGLKKETLSALPILTPWRFFRTSGVNVESLWRRLGKPTCALTAVQEVTPSEVGLGIFSYICLPSFQHEQAPLGASAKWMRKKSNSNGMVGSWMGDISFLVWLHFYHQYRSQCRYFWQ